MKNIYLTSLVIITFASSAFSQTEKGGFMVGGSMGLHSTDANGIKSTGLSFSPTGSYFIFDRFAAGLILGSSVGKATSSSFESNSNGFTIGPTVRYFIPLSEKWALFPQMEYTYSRFYSKTTDLASNFESTSTSTVNSTKAGAGITYFFADNVGVEGFLYTPIGATEKSINFRVSLQVYIHKNPSAEQ